ncbi:fumarylacetoacetate hydrolase family protein [Aliikangiella marina]|uniref:Fumarylacetoacetate hydrolase family protein n=1 Tax=Aliikangiella marina TaxID=1712262 RepID=A0A545TIE0_9GAMM|nr:fumarylacetoacetate hydrolase family protein [Aliikangiella marina]TQV76999.1 fumarylacetoacetate hydrolase family protein [Aliikangiella marina]
MNFEQWFVPELINKSGDKINYQYPTSKVVCVGRNYVEHARELNNPVPKAPLLFIKPNSSLRSLRAGIVLPDLPFSCHYETELALLIGKTIKHNENENLLSKITGIGLALDLTLRDLQQKLKTDGKPWEKAKAFDGSCPVSEFIHIQDKDDLNTIRFELRRNQELVQQAQPSEMIFSIEELLIDASRYFTLYPGDILLTGTPAGVGQLELGDELTLQLNHMQWQTRVMKETEIDG